MTDLEPYLQKIEEGVKGIREKYGLDAHDIQERVDAVRAEEADLEKEEAA